MQHREPYTETTIVSRYWTPDHLDVTYVPITYARPKAAWLEGFEALRPVMNADAQDRLFRRRLQSNAVVADPGDLTVAPPIERPVEDRE